MKTNVLIIISAVITVCFCSCSMNYPKEVNNRIEKLKEQGAKILAHSNDDTGAEHYIVYKTDTELIYDDIDSKKVLLKKGQWPNQVVLDIDSLKPDLTTKVVPCSAQYDIVSSVLEDARTAIVKNGFVYVKGEKEKDWWGVILSSGLPNVVMMEEWVLTDKGNLKVTGISGNAVGVTMEYFIQRIYGNTSILNTMQSKIMGYESECGLVTREAAINFKGEIAELSPNYIISEGGNRPILYYEYPADQLNDAEGIKKFISVYDAAFMKEIVEPIEEQERQEEARREQERHYYEERSNTIYNYECKYCHSIIQMPDKGPDFFTGQCPYHDNFNHHWERIK